MMRRVHRVAFIVLIATGAAIFASAIYQPLVAYIGHARLERAYESGQTEFESRTQPVDATLAADGAARAHAVRPDPVRPWPWADIAPIARLTFPSLGKSRIVLDRASGEAMAWGVGHVVGTAPLGHPGFSAVAGHRDTHFSLLQYLEPGDVVELETLEGASVRYEVFFHEVVDETVYRFPVVFDGPDVLALATCWPFGALTPGPERYVVLARRLPAAGGDAVEVAADAAPSLMRATMVRGRDGRAEGRKPRFERGPARSDAATTAAPTVLAAADAPVVNVAAVDQPIEPALASEPVLNEVTDPTRDETDT